MTSNLCMGTQKWQSQYILAYEYFHCNYCVIQLHQFFQCLKHKNYTLVSIHVIVCPIHFAFLFVFIEIIIENKYFKKHLTFRYYNNEFNCMHYISVLNFAKYCIYAIFLGMQAIIESRMTLHLCQEHDNGSCNKDYLTHSFITSTL